MPAPAVGRAAGSVRGDWRATSLVLAALGALCGAALLPRVAWTRAPLGPLPASVPCRIVATRAVSPTRLSVGDDLALTTRLELACSPADSPSHVVLIVDASEQMSDRGRNWLPVMLGDLEAAVRRLGLRQKPWMRIGIVSYRNRTAETHSRLSNDAEELSRALHDISVGYGSDCPQCGLREALRKARRMLQLGDGESPGARQVFVIASRGFDPAVCDAVRAATTELRSSGALVITACGGGCERRCLSESASAQRFAFAGGDWSYLGGVLQDLAGLSGTFWPVTAVGLEERLGDLVSYAGGGEPSAMAGSLLSWTFPVTVTFPLTRSLRLTARQAGSGPVSVASHAWLRHGAWVTSELTRTFELERPVIAVEERTRHTPSPTSSDTATPEGSDTPAASATAARTEPATPATATAPSRPLGQAYLPAGLTGRCPPGIAPLDVVFVVDVSGSMAAADVPPFENRWAAAGAVAEEIVRYHAGPLDRFAVIPFGATAQVRAGLGEDRAAVLAALRSLPRWNGSRLDLALLLARTELERGRADRPGNRPTVVLLTDGDPNQAEVEALLAAAKGLRAWGARMHAVALGSDVDPALLARLTGSLGRVHVIGRDASPLGVAETVGRVLHCRW